MIYYKIYLFINLFIIKILNYKETLLKISQNICKTQQKFYETMNVSIQLLEKPKKLLISITKYMKKYI